jgi:3',5'-cyclic AMP phosphodiesterase CpdA
MRFLHLSDLHFHRDDIFNKENIKILKLIKEKYKDHYLLITGDIVDDGDEQQFNTALKYLSDFKNKIFICPGNHDYGVMGNFYDPVRAERFDEILSLNLNQGGFFIAKKKPIVNVVKDENDEVMLIALNSNLETEEPWDFACGEIGDAQLNELDGILTDPVNRQLTKILFLHHHPFMFNDPAMKLLDSEKFLRRIYQKVDVLLFGHKHEEKEDVKWENIAGVKHVLASGSYPSTKTAWELNADCNNIEINHVELK